MYISGGVSCFKKLEILFCFWCADVNLLLINIYMGDYYDGGFCFMQGTCEGLTYVQLMLDW